MGTRQNNLNEAVRTSTHINIFSGIFFFKLCILKSALLHVHHCVSPYRHIFSLSDVIRIIIDKSRRTIKLYAL